METIKDIQKRNRHFRTKCLKCSNFNFICGASPKEIKENKILGNCPKIRC